MAPKRSAHRKKRLRRPPPGMMLFQDGSQHELLAGQSELDLIVTLDDATSEIYSAFLVEEEGTASSFMGSHEMIAAKGLFSSLYTDQGSHYFLTPKAGGKVDRAHLTQVGRALAELKIEHIPSYSPEGRAAWSGCSAPCRRGCRRCCGCTASRRSRQPTGTRGRSTSPSTTAALRSPRPKRGALSYRFLAPCVTSCAFVMSVSSAMTHRALRRAGVADPGAAPSPAFRQGDRSGARIPQWHAGNLPWSAAAGRLPPGRHLDRGGRRYTISRLSPQGQQQQQRTFDVLRKPDIFKAIDTKMARGRPSAARVYSSSPHHHLLALSRSGGNCTSGATRGNEQSNPHSPDEAGILSALATIMG
jgi:hypothetical protein